MDNDRSRFLVNEDVVIFFCPHHGIRAEATANTTRTMPYEEPAEIDPSPIVISFALSISFFPAVAVLVDPVLGQRSTLRHLLIVYKGECYENDHGSCRRSVLLGRASSFLCCYAMV